MDLAPTAEQQAVREQARRLLTSELTRERRLAWDASAEGYDSTFWSAVAGAGWLGFALPERYGGHGASLLDLGLLLEETGRAAAPLAVFAAITGGLALAELGTEAQRAEWLPRIARGQAQLALAVAEADAVLNPGALRATVLRQGDRLVVSGEKRWVLQGQTADAFLVAARDGGGVSVILVPRDAPGVRVVPSTALGKDRQATLVLAEVTLPASACGAAPGIAWQGLERVRHRCAALACLQAVGGTEAVLEMTVRHVCEREQFGAKLGTFQAVQQMVAVMAIELEGARHVARQAVWRLSEGLPAEREVAIAKAWAARAYRDVCLLGHQLHGGAGYVVEHELHRHTLRAQQLVLLFGSTEEWLEELADRLALTPGS